MSALRGVVHTVKIFIAGTETQSWLHVKMKEEEKSKGKEYLPMLLMSYYSLRKRGMSDVPKCFDFLLDSGAFTFMQGRGTSQNWDEYIEQYADFVKANRIQKYFELDIDSIIGVENVKKIRKRLEALTGIQPIPVWHKCRGKDGFIDMCKEYPYVAIGGLTNGTGQGEYARKLWRYFPWFIDTAHKHNSKIHALGFSSFEGMLLYHFDSIDSTSWMEGHKYRLIDRFDGKRMRRIRVPDGFKLKDPKEVAMSNYSEWYKLQRYALNHL